MQRTPAEETSTIFLGLAERADYVREGNTNFCKWNIIGLKDIVLAYVYPLSLDGFHIGFAVQKRAAGNTISIRLVGPDRVEAGTITIALQVTKPLEQPPAALRDGSSAFLSAQQEWIPLFMSLKDSGIAVLAPGEYLLEETQTQGNRTLGSIYFALLRAPELTPERIAAIKSDPSAVKEVRIVIGCRKCPSKLGTYAGFERREGSDGSVGTWYQDLPETFTCECGNTKVPLTVLRTNLHALLGRTGVVADQGTTFSALYEQGTLQELSTSFRRLLAKDPTEEELQQFLQANPILLHEIPAERLFARPPILTSFQADFGIVTPNRELVLIEIERSSTKLMRKNGDEAAPLQHAFDQVRNWLGVADEHRLAVLDSLKIERNQVSNVKGLVIAGRDHPYRQEDLRRLKGVDRGRVALRTYDDLLANLKALIRRMEER